MHHDQQHHRSTTNTNMTHHRKTSSTGLLSSMSHGMDDDTHEDEERRNPNRKSSRLFKHRNNISQGSKRHLRASQKRRKAGITVDTTHSRHKGMTPKEIRYGSNMDKHNGLRIFTSPRTADESPILPKDKWWANSRVKRQLSRRNKSRPSNDHPMPPAFVQGESSGDSNIDGLDVVRNGAPNEGLSPSKLRMLDISPSDRRIFVGLSIPSESLSEVESDMEARTRKRSDSDSSPFTPTIIITPAQQRSQFVQHKPRPASSVYSRATHVGRTPFMQRESQPPMPRLPENAKYNSVAVNSVAVATVTTAYSTKNGVGERDDTWPKQARDSNMTAFEEDDDTPRGNRILSSGTYFEEDEGLNIVRRELTISKDPLSIDTEVPTPRRSRGWWNVITTPFEHSNSLWTRYTAADDSTPEVPKLSQSQSTNVPLGLITAKMEDSNNGPPLVSCFSASTITTMASPWSAVEAERSPISPFGQSLAPVYKAHAGPELSIAEQLSKPSPQQSAIASVVDPFETPETDRRLSPFTQGSPPQTDRSTVWPSAYPSHQSRSYTSTTFSLDTGSVPAVATAKLGTIMTPNAVHQTNEQAPRLPAPKQAEVAQNHYTMFPAAHLPRRTPSPSQQSTKSSSHRDSILSKHRGPPGYAPDTYFPAPPISEKHQEVQKQKRKTIFTCFGKTKDKKKRKKRMCLVCGICWGILLAVVLIVVLVLLLTKRHKPDDTPVQSQWLNITNFPPIPTGISTIAQPELAYEESGCVEPATQWSCALPKEEHASVAPNKPDQPNFRLVIRYKNDTASKTRRDATPARTLAVRDEDLFSPSPEPPSTDEQDFLGNTTDKITEPFAGEGTPFFISFISPTSAPPPTRVKRQNNDDSNNDDENSFSNITDVIPPPSTISGGLAAPANLLPIPTAQPLRLYNRGQPDEHYGFYTYFDKSIFLKDIAGTNSSFGGNSADNDGGALFDSATLRCTFSQTRFLVQIWTNSAQSKPLLGAPGAQAQTQTQSADAAAATEVSSSSATTFLRPGSFPYPVSITLDRHGGALEKKMVYCYGIDKHGKIEPDRKTFTLEDRSFSGDSVNPAQGPFTDVPVGRDEGGPGGIDGGSGGCGCQWTNWAEQ